MLPMKNPLLCPKHSNSVKYSMASFFFFFFASELPYWFLSLRCLSLKLQCCVSCKPKWPLLSEKSYCWRQGCGLNITVVAGQQMSIGSQVGDAVTLAMIKSMGGCVGAWRERCWFFAGLLFVGEQALVAGSWVLVLWIRVVCYFAQRQHNWCIFVKGNEQKCLAGEEKVYPSLKCLCRYLRMHA